MRHRRTRMPARQNRSKLRSRLVILSAFVLIASICAAGYAGLMSGYFDIREIVFEGNRHLSDAELIGLAEVGIGRNLLLLQAEQVYENLHASPWLKKVSVRKELPARLVIKVAETEPGAVLRSRSGSFLIDTDGIVLKELSEDSAYFLPVIFYDSPDSSEVFAEAMKLAAVINEYGIPRENGRIEIRGLEKGLKDIFVSIDGVSVKLGGGRYREKLDRFFQFSGEIAKRMQEVEYVDLRFANRVVVKPVQEAEVIR